MNVSFFLFVHCRRVGDSPIPGSQIAVLEVNAKREVILNVYFFSQALVHMLMAMLVQRPRRGTVI